MEKVWLKNYPAGVPAEINADAYTSLVQVLEESFKNYASRKAFISMDKGLTYADLDKIRRRSAPICNPSA